VRFAIELYKMASAETLAILFYYSYYNILRRKLSREAGGFIEGLHS